MPKKAAAKTTKKEFAAELMGGEQFTFGSEEELNEFLAQHPGAIVK